MNPDTQEVAEAAEAARLEYVRFLCTELDRAEREHDRTKHDINDAGHAYWDGAVDYLVLALGNIARQGDGGLVASTWPDFALGEVEDEL